MPAAPLPADVLAFLAKPNPAVVASVRPDGSPHSVPTWYDIEPNGLVLLNMDATRLRLSFIRAEPRISLTVLDEATWYTHVSLLGRIVRIDDDADLADIDRLARRYTGSPFRNREARRVSAWLEPARWHRWS